MTTSIIPPGGPDSSQHPAFPRCVVCDDAGCEHCPRVPDDADSPVLRLDRNLDEVTQDAGAGTAIASGSHGRTRLAKDIRAVKAERIGTHR